jgi:hypothetical protein
MPPTIEDVESDKQKRMKRVNELLNSSVDDEETTGMGHFQPLTNPIMSKTPELNNNVMPESIKYSPLVPTPIEEPQYGNYHQMYEQPMTFVPTRKPYYANMGISSQGGSEMDKILEKLNYMTHLLEEQKNEKTNNIGEEFILYTFLGVFMIYVVDSFSRSGKYIR